MLIGYARVSTGDQNLDLQKNALVRAECEQIFEDTASGKNARRPGLRRAIRRLKPGDSLVVWKLDRLGRSVRDLISLVSELQDKGHSFPQPDRQYRHINPSRAILLSRHERVGGNGARTDSGEDPRRTGGGESRGVSADVAE